mmetsp:Transcript_1337/g.4814  ORF Transcript_1337/g.4814 Transcript_1337/m.4814 type:complete len:546 (+) Transcript_1337:152-1789(+)
MSLLFDLDRSTDEDWSTGSAGSTGRRRLRTTTAAQPLESSESDSDDEWLRGKAYGEREEAAVPLDEEEDPLDDDEDEEAGTASGGGAEETRAEPNRAASASAGLRRIESPSRPIEGDRKPALGRATSLRSSSNPGHSVLLHSFSGSSSPDDSPKKARLKRKEKSERSLVRLFSNPHILISSVKGKERANSKVVAQSEAQSSTSKYYFRSMVLESSCTILSVLLSNEVLEQYNKQEQLYILYCIVDMCLENSFLCAVVRTFASAADDEQGFGSFAEAMSSETAFPPFNLEGTPLRQCPWWYLVQMGLYHITIHTTWIQEALEAVISELNLDPLAWQQERPKSRFSLKKSKRQKTFRHKVFPFVQRFLCTLFNPSLDRVPRELLYFLSSLHQTVEESHPGSGVGFLKHAIVGLLLSPCLDAPAEYGVEEEPFSGAAAALSLFPTITREILGGSQSGSDSQDIQAGLAEKCARRFDKFVSKVVKWDAVGSELLEMGSLSNLRSQFILTQVIGLHLDAVLEHALEHCPEVAMKCGQFASLGLDHMALDS